MSSPEGHSEADQERDSARPQRQRLWEACRTGDVRYHSPTLLGLLLERVQCQRQQLLDRSTELGKITLVHKNDQEYPRVRASDPDGDNDAFNSKHAEINLSRIAPGLLGHFVPLSFEKIKPETRVAYYSGQYMLYSEFDDYQRDYAQSMGVDLYDVLGVDNEGTEQGVYLVGDPSCVACQALHQDTNTNCRLVSRCTAQQKSVWLQSTRVLRGGDEVCLAYDRQPRKKAGSSGDNGGVDRFEKACFVCHLRIPPSELHNKRAAFQCHGFIDGSKCPHHVHRSCVESLNVQGEYCHFCSLYSLEDDSCMHSTVVSTMEFLSVPSTKQPSAERTVIHSNRSFAAVLHQARSLGFVVVAANILNQHTYPNIPPTDRGTSSSTRRIEYVLGTDSESSGEPFACVPTPAALDLTAHVLQPGCERQNVPSVVNSDSSGEMISGERCMSGDTSPCHSATSMESASCGIPASDSSSSPQLAAGLTAMRVAEDTTDESNTTDSDDSEYMEEELASSSRQLAPEPFNQLPVRVEDCITMRYVSSQLTLDHLLQHCAGTDARPRAGWIETEDFIHAQSVADEIEVCFSAFASLCDKAWQGGSELERARCPAELREVLSNVWLHKVLSLLNQCSEWRGRPGAIARRELGKRKQSRLCKVINTAMWDEVTITRVATMLQGVRWSGETGKMFATVQRDTASEDPNYDSWWDDQDRPLEARADANDSATEKHVSGAVVATSNATSIAPRPVRQVTIKQHQRSSLAALFAHHPSRRQFLPNGTFCSVPLDLDVKFAGLSRKFVLLHGMADGSCGWHSYYYVSTERWLDAAQAWETGQVNGRLPEHLRSDRPQKSGDADAPRRIMQKLAESISRAEYDRLHKEAMTNDIYDWPPFSAIVDELQSFGGWQSPETLMMAARQAGINLFVLVERGTLQWQYNADKDNERYSWQYGTIHRRLFDHGVILCSSTGELEFQSASDEDRNTVFLYLYHMQSAWTDATTSKDEGAKDQPIHGHWTAFIDRATKQSRWSTCSPVVRWLLAQTQRPPGDSATQVQPTVSLPPTLTTPHLTLREALTSGDYLKQQSATQPQSHLEELIRDLYGHVPTSFAPATASDSSVIHPTSLSTAADSETSDPAAADDPLSSSPSSSESVASSVPAVAPEPHVAKKQPEIGERLTAQQLHELERVRDKHHATRDRKIAEREKRAKKKRAKHGALDVDSHQPKPRPRKDKQCERCDATACYVDEFEIEWGHITACCLSQATLTLKRESLKLPHDSTEQHSLALAEYFKRDELRSSPASIYSARLVASMEDKRRMRFFKVYRPNLPADLQSYLAELDTVVQAVAPHSSASASDPESVLTRSADKATEREKIRRNTKKIITGLKLSFDTVPLCRACWCRVNAVSSTTFDDWVTALMTGEDGTHGNAGTHRLTVKQAAVLDAIRETALERGDHAPDAHIIALPVRTMQQLTNVVNQKLAATYTDQLRASRTTVSRAFRQLKKRLKLSGQHHTLAQCTTCVNFITKKTPPTKEEIDLHEVHQRIQQNERTQVELNILMTVNNPDEYLCISIDGMDQAKTDLPHLAIKPKWLDNSSVYRLGQKVTGVLAWGINRTYAYINAPHIQSRSALTIHILMDVLRRVWKEIGESIDGRADSEANGERKSDGVSDISRAAAADTDGTTAQQASMSQPRHRYTRYPSTLLLHMDNSSKDNKNNAVFSFLAHLVQRGWFREIRVNFLIVGHTHDRVDQFFSCISRHLQTVDVWTVKQLHDAVKASYGQHAQQSAAELVLDPLCMTEPEVVQLFRIGDWSDFFSSKATDCVGAPVAVNIDHITTPQVFRITMNAHDAVLLETKDFSDEVKLVRDELDLHQRPVYHCKPLQWSTPTILIPPSAPVPFLDPLVAAPSHGLDIDVLRVETTEKMEQANEFKNSAELHRQWLEYLDEHEREVALGVCSTCVNFRLEMDSIIVLSQYKLRDMPEKEIAENKTRQRKRIELEKERVAHSANRTLHSDNSFHGLWSSPMLSSMYGDADLRDRVLASRSLHALQPHSGVDMHFPGCLSEEQLDKHHEAWKRYRTGELELRRQRLLDEIKSLDKNEKSRQTAAHYNDNVAGAQERSAKLTTGAECNNNMHQVSADEEGRGGRMGELSVVDSLYQRRNLPIHVGDIVVIIQDNYQWPEYHVSVYLVSAVIQPTKTKARSSKQAGKKRGRNIRNKNSDNERSTGAAKIDWQYTSKGIKVCSADFHKKRKRHDIIQQLMEHGHTAEEVERLRDKFLMHGDEKEDENIYHAYPFYLQWPSHKFALSILNQKIERYIQYGDTVQLQHIADEQERQERERQTRDDDVQEDADDSIDVKEDDRENAVDREDEEFEPPTRRRPLSRLQEKRRRQQLKLRQKRDIAIAKATARLSPSLSSSHTHSVDASLSNQSNPTTAAAVPAVAANQLSPSALAQLRSLSSKFLWTRAGGQEPDLWDNVFTEVNHTFEPARPEGRVLKNIQPMYSLLDYRPRQLSLHLLHNRSQTPYEALRKCEILAWDAPHKVLDKDGFFVDDFIIKVQASINEYRSVHGGWYADDSITSEEEEDEEQEEEQKQCEGQFPAPRPDSHWHQLLEERGTEPVITEPTGGHRSSQALPPSLSLSSRTSRPPHASSSTLNSVRPTTPPPLSQHSHASARPSPPKRQNPPRSRKEPDRLKQDEWGVKGRGAAQTLKRKRVIDAIDAEQAQLPIIPGTAGTLAEVMPRQLEHVVQSEVPRSMESDLDTSPAPLTSLAASQSPSLSAQPIGVLLQQSPSALVTPSTAIPESPSTLSPTTLAVEHTLSAAPTETTPCSLGSVVAEPTTAPTPAVSMTQLLEASLSQHSVDSQLATQHIELDDEIMIVRHIAPTEFDCDDGADQQDDVVRAARLLTDELSQMQQSDDTSDDLLCAMDDKAESSTDESNWSVARSDRAEESDSHSSVSY